MANKLPIQPTINIGLVGHVDHGKTTLTKLLSGKWTDTHSEEKKRGITIKLGYSNFIIYKNPESGELSVKDKGGYEPLRKLSLVDAPGHEAFMATMISGSAVMDSAILLIAANEPCPKPQTVEHLKTLEISGIKDIIVVQNKVDLVTKEEAIENFHQIKEFLKGTIAENAPIIPMSAQHGANLSVLLEYIMKFKEPERDVKSDPIMFVVRSFDINKPGESYKNLKGGILGGSIKKGTLKVGDKIEIRPGFAHNKEGKTFYSPIKAKVVGLMSDKDKLDSAIAGGSIAVMTELDPTMTKTDSLVGQMVGLEGKLDEPKQDITFELHLFDKIVTSDGEVPVKPIIPNEPLMLIVNSLTTVGIPYKVNSKEVKAKLKRPVMCFKDDRVVIFRRIHGNKWKISGYGIIKE
jgi:translation initiation factor 2 subunit 3